MNKEISELRIGKAAVHSFGNDEGVYVKSKLAEVYHCGHCIYCVDGICEYELGYFKSVDKGNYCSRFYGKGENR